MSVENNTGSIEFDQSLEREKIETEKKYSPIDPNFFDFLKQLHEQKNIHQVYLSHPTEPFSLRLRQIEQGDKTVYTAAGKARGNVTAAGLKRLETPTIISKEVFQHITSAGQYASLDKLRIEPVPGVSIDWIDGWELPIIEIEELETNEEAQQFLHVYKSQLVDHSGELIVDNEHIAYVLSGLDFESKSYEVIQPEDVVSEILAQKDSLSKPLVIGISGRSGSGKTTLARQIQTILAHQNQIACTILSTDDYHVGRSYLETTYGAPWLNWDSPLVYDTKQLAVDIKRLRHGKEIGKRVFDFESQEPDVEGVVRPREVIIVEGIHAGNRHLDTVRDMYVEMPTPFATSVGRDISRLRDGTRPNSSIGTPEIRLAYQLAYAEPSYLEKDNPKEHSLPTRGRHIGSLVLEAVTRSVRSIEELLS